MNPVLFESPPGRVPRWEITRYSTTDPTLIRFVKHGRASKLLDQVARWHGGRWDPARWQPGAKVPKDIMRVVLGELVRQEVVS